MYVRMRASVYECVCMYVQERECECACAHVQLNLGSLGNPAFRAPIVTTLPPDSMPDCWTTARLRGVIAGERIEYDCSLNYTGRWAPVILWSSSGHRPVHTINSTVPGFVSYHFHIVVTPADDGTRFTATLHFRQPPPDVGRNDAAFGPDHRSSVSTRPLNVLCELRTACS